MPEVANVPLPRRLLREGVTDMVRISDGRMSGTGFGTVVLHVSPEAATGGPLALVRTGDRVRLDVPGRSLTLQVAEEELQRRAQEPAEGVEGATTSGWGWLYRQHVLQAEDGVDLDFLRGSRGSAVPRESH
jgi:dihydroxy-acid dehydratase